LVNVGSNVTLRSLLPGSTSTDRVSGFQFGSGAPFAATAVTTTVYVPTGRTILIGVTLPVSFPLTKTLAPVGDEVTFNTPFCAPALLGTSKIALINTIKQTILLGCVIESSLNALLAVNLEQTPRGCGSFRGDTWMESGQCRVLPHLT